MSNSYNGSYGVLIRAYGPTDPPGDARYREYSVDGDDRETAIEHAVEKANNHFRQGIINHDDNYDIVEVEVYE